MEREHTIYLTSAACNDIYPNNRPYRFTNRLAAPISLDPKFEYEIGLVSILYPQEYYAVIRHQEKYSISFYSKLRMNKEISSFTYTIKNNILAGDMDSVIKSLNTEINPWLKTYFHRTYDNVFQHKDLFYWDRNKKVVGIHYSTHPKTMKLKKGDLEEVKVQFREGIAQLLGFKSNTAYPIYGTYHEHPIVSSNPVYDRCGVDYMYLYTDIIQPTNFGSQLVNILDCFTLDNGRSRGIHNTLYKQLNTNYIDEISIIITDQVGRIIYFNDDSTITCVLHIRPK